MVYSESLQLMSQTQLLQVEINKIVLASSLKLFYSSTVGCFVDYFTSGEQQARKLNFRNNFRISSLCTVVTVQTTSYFPVINKIVNWFLFQSNTRKQTLMYTAKLKIRLHKDSDTTADINLNNDLILVQLKHICLCSDVVMILWQLHVPSTSFLNENGKV